MGVQYAIGMGHEAVSGRHRPQGKTQGIIRKLLVAVLSLLLLASLAACDNREREADDLMASGDYSSALEIYEELDSTPELEDKMSDCRRAMFVDYIRSSGPISVNATADTTDNSFSVDGSEIRINRYDDIIVERTEQSLTNDSGSLFIATTVITLTFSKDSDQAEAAATYECATLDASAKLTGLGTLDIPSYTSSTNIVWDETTDEAQTNSGYTSTLGIDVLGNNASTTYNALQDLAQCMEDSGTGCTLSDLGFQV